MKLVVAIVQPHKLREVQTAVKDFGIPGLTASDLRGHGRQRGHTEVYRGAEYTIDVVPKSRVEVLVHDRDVDGLVDRIVNTARTGEIGDGKVWVLDVDEVYRIRTGESGPGAI